MVRFFHIPRWPRAGCAGADSRMAACKRALALLEVVPKAATGDRFHRKCRLPPEAHRNGELGRIALAPSDQRRPRLSNSSAMIRSAFGRPGSGHHKWINGSWVLHSDSAREDGNDSKQSAEVLSLLRVRPLSRSEGDRHANWFKS
jgi:hypothetical protein